VNNHFQGENVAHLVEEELHKYTRLFLHTFRDYALTQD
jgi:hypothetical protein